MVKIKSEKSELLIELLITILAMMGCFILLDLYVPVKRLLSGDNLNFREVLAYIELRRHIPIVIAVAVGSVFYNYSKRNKENN